MNMKAVNLKKKIYNFVQNKTNSQDEKTTEENSHTCERLKEIPWWLIVIALSFTFTICYILIKKPISMEFDFTSFLSLILAIFSIWLSVTFYFKATKTSNDFYHRAYDFTLDTRKLLSDTNSLLIDIRSTFGEKLTHLKESNKGLDEKFTQILHYAVSSLELKKTWEEQYIEKKEKIEEEKQYTTESKEMTFVDLQDVNKILVEKLGGFEYILDANPREIQIKYESVKSSFDKNFTERLQKIHVTNSKGKLNLLGMSLLKYLAMDFFYNFIPKRTSELVSELKSELKSEMRSELSFFENTGKYPGPITKFLNEITDKMKKGPISSIEMENIILDEMSKEEFRNAFQNTLKNTLKKLAHKHVPEE